MNHLITGVKNSGNSELVIYNTKTSCGCTVGEPTKKNLKPGETAEIHVSFNTTGREGENKKSVTVITNDPYHSLVNIDVTATVEK